jgi:hypothetical protein
LQSYTGYEYDKIKDGREVDFVIHPHSKGFEDIHFKKHIPLDMKIGELKRMILHKT